MNTPKITPEMISDDISDAVLDLVKEASLRQIVVGALNAALDDTAIRAVFVAKAIELGEASPAVYYRRLAATAPDCLRGIAAEHIVITPEKEESPPAIYTSEHWKGQKE